MTETKLAHLVKGAADQAAQYRAMAHAIRTCVKASGVVDEEVARLEGLAAEMDREVVYLTGAR